MSELIDDVTRTAIADHARGKRIDHDANQRQARTSMNPWRENHEWGRPVYLSRAGHLIGEKEQPDVGVDEQLLAMHRLDRDAIEGLARQTHRTYRSILRRRQRLRSWRRQWSLLNTDEHATCPPMPDRWR